MKDSLRFFVFGSVFAVPFVLLWVASEMFFPYITGKNFAFRILVELAVASWILLAIYDQAYRPRLSAIVVAIAGLVGVMLLADVFGEYAQKSIWSNYERMEGWVTLLHFFLYFMVLGTVVNTEKLWTRFFNTALVAAGIMSLFSLAQVAGTSEVMQGSSWRIYGQLGNSSYLAVYMLFHMFIAAWLFLRTNKGSSLRWLYSGLFVLFAYLLIHTGTRGTTLGLVGGASLTFLYVAMMAPKGAAIKKWALGGVVALVITAGGLVIARNTEFVANNAILSRIANINLEQGSIRFTVWSMAWEGFKERPILGWGQENFSYVFNKYYDPSLYQAEAWYDRTHNIFMDWLVTGGLLGLVSYLAILIAALYYVVLSPLWRRLKERSVQWEEYFSVYEQALLLGLLAAYMFHNLFVFDNLASWIFYAVILAFIHSRVAVDWSRMQGWSVSPDICNKVIAPTVLVVAMFVIYTTNVPGIKAASSIIDAYQASTVEGRLQHFKAAINSGTFADQEVVEQMSQVGGRLLVAESVSNVQKDVVKQEVKAALNYIQDKKVGDARLYVIGATFYRLAGDLNGALSQLQIAESLSPTKQAIISEQAVLYIMAGQYDMAATIAARSYELDKNNYEALSTYVTALLYMNDTNRLAETVDWNTIEENYALRRSFANDSVLARAAYENKNYDWLIMLAETKIETSPQDIIARTNLAALYMELGDKEAARSVVQTAISEIPSFTAEGNKLLEQMN